MSARRSGGPAGRSPAARAAVGALVLAAALAMVGVGCGVTQEESPRAISTKDVPFGLLDPVNTTTSTSVLAPDLQPGAMITVYLLDQDGLVLPAGRLALADDPWQVLRTLFEGTRPAESAAGLRSAIPVATELRGFRTGPEEGAAIVDLSDDFLTVQGEQQIKAVAQVVMTLTELPGITGVRFAFEGQVRPVFRGQGDLTDAPLTRASFAALMSSAGRPPVGSTPPTSVPPA